MSNTDLKFQIPPIRSLREFIEGNDWTKPNLNPKEFDELQKQVISNLIYFQSNYGVIFIPFLLLVGYFRPAAILSDLLVIALLLVVFFYLTRERTIITIHFRDRPILILILVLVAAFIIISTFSSVWVFLIGFVLPLALIVVHATLRKPSFQNKAANVVENLSLKTSPMGFVLGWLGLKSIGNQSKPSTQTK
ncbi:unnamed protein product [Rotaria sordida]|uniref:PRA1 family protein n=1 Tax=Rotaria sordida TaxID=392033 RepID=A0A818W2K8_9BILA|nr:unnamed protein product [Rotaria sordida]CAF1119845.1 unnamed protein product [Rotaria sordida]CAF1209598.1 unnamed protein product [Rotaria sordida]CAF1232773.1 unnamed protein product [Rotaria sordida]CAF1470469.1 unnamed protein product [Rotaria sordida]